MTKKIFLGIMTICVIAVTAAAVLVTALLYEQSSDRAEKELKNAAALIAAAVESSGEEYLGSARLGEGLRVTWIDSAGRVVFDSAEEPASMGDHSDRKEVLEALENGEGSSSRYSETIMRSTLNYAVRLSDGSVIRVSAEYSSFTAQLLKAMRPMLLILAAVVLFSAAAATVVSRNIVRPINDIDLYHPDTGKSYKELRPLLDKLRSQNGKVNRNMEELRRSREQFSLITESMSDGLIVTDPKLNILTCNSGARRLLGSPSFTMGRSVYALNNSEVFRRCLLNALGGRRSECVLRTGSGQCGVIASPASTTNMVCGIVVFIMDVTERHELETMRREFTSNVSHELKTPLTTIYGISDMLANGMVKQEDVAGFGGNIRSEAERLINLISDIISLSKLDEDAAPRENENVDLYDLAQEVLERLSLSAEEKNVKVSLLGEHVSLLGSSTILSQIIYNLCDNAINYNVPGGSVNVKISHIPKTAIITVSDTGMGIPEQHLSRIFERFYRVDKSRSRRIKGTGLGLSIVKHGVMYHGGSVRAESTPGKGSIFTVELPIERSSN